MGRGEVYTYIVSVGTPGGHIPLEDAGLCGRIILKRIFKKWGGGMNSIDLAQDG